MVETSEGRPAANNALHLPPILDQSERLLVAESGPSFSWLSSILNDRFREKRTFSRRLEKSGRRATTLPPEADIPVILR